MKKLFILNGLLFMILLSGCSPATPMLHKQYFNDADGIPIVAAKEILDGTMKTICQKEHGKIDYWKWGSSCKLFQRCEVVGRINPTYKSRNADNKKARVTSIYYQFNNDVAIKSWNPFDDQNCSSRLDAISKELFNIQDETIEAIKLRIEKEQKAKIKWQKQEQEKQALKRKQEQEKQKKLAIERQIKQEKKTKLALKRKKEHDAKCQKIQQEIVKSSGLQQISLYKKLDTLNCQ